MGSFLAGDIYQKTEFDATIDLTGMVNDLGNTKKRIDFDSDNQNNCNNSNGKNSFLSEKKNSSRNLRADASAKSTPCITMICDNDSRGDINVGKSPSSQSHSFNPTEYTMSRNKGLDIGDGFTRGNTGVLREKGTRRTRVSQCKNLRAFILGFENNWLLKHGVAAKVFYISFCDVLYFMLCYFMLCHVMLYYVILCYVM